MKKNKNLIIILLFLAGASAYFILSKKNTTIRSELKDFAVKDTAAITKIFLADKSGNSITLERKNNKWILNEKFEPKDELVSLLLNSISKVQVKTKVANAAYNNVIKMLASTGVKCEIYLGNEKQPSKVYYVGGHTEDAEGTFMMLENSSTPFITEVAGFTGYLTPRYNTGFNAWRSTRLFSYRKDDIQSVSVAYTNYPEKSLQSGTDLNINDNKPFNKSVHSPFFQSLTLIIFPK